MDKASTELELEQLSLKSNKKRKRKHERPEGDFAFLVEIFDEAQRTVTVHEQNAAEVARRFKDCPERLVSLWKPLIKSFCQRWKDEQPVKKLHKFIVRITTMQNNEVEWSDKVSNKFMTWLLEFVNAGNKSVRLRVCSLIGGVLNEMNENAEIDTFLWEKLEKCLVDRFNDKVKEIRKAACLALNRLQDADNPRECKIIKSFIDSMSHDKEKECRLECLKLIDMNRITVQDVVYRVRDEEEIVRQYVYEKLQPVEPKALSIRQRVCVLGAGINDRNDKVRKSCSKLVVGKWLPSVDNNIIKFLELLDPEEYHDTIDKVLIHLFDEFDTQQELRIDPEPPYESAEQLTSVTAFFWRVLCDWYKKNDRQEDLENALPDTNIFCELIQAHKDNEFICHQLLKLTVHLDDHDEHGRNTLVQQCRELLKDLNFNNDFIPDVMRILRKLYKNEKEDFVRLIREDMEEIRDPLHDEEQPEVMSEEERTVKESEFEQLDLQRKLTVQEENDAVKNKNYAVAQQKKSEVERLVERLHELEQELGKDYFQEKMIHIRSFSIVIDLLQNTNLSPTNEFITSLENDVIMHSWQQEMWSHETEIRRLGVKALGVFCMLTKANALSHMWIFYNLSNEDEAVAFVMLETLLDFLFRYDFTDDELMNAYNPLALRDDEVENQEKREKPTLKLTNAKLIDHIYQKLVQTENPELLKVVASGFCKLLMANKLTHKRRKIFTKLFLLYFDEKPCDPQVRDRFADSDDLEEEVDQTAEEEKKEKIAYTRQVLSLFFPLYAGRDLNKRAGCKTLIMQSLIEAIMTISNAPAKSSLKSINHKKVINFALHMLEQEESTISQSQLHCKLAWIVLQNLNHGQARSYIMRNFCDILQKLNLSHAQQKSLKCIKRVADDVKNGIVERTAKKDWDKFYKNLSTAISKIEEVEKKKEEEKDEPMENENSALEQEEELPEDFVDLEQDAKLTQEIFSQVPYEYRERKRSLPLSQVHVSPQNGRKRKLNRINAKRAKNVDEENRNPSKGKKRAGSKKSSRQKKKRKIEEDEDSEEMLDDLLDENNENEPEEKEDKSKAQVKSKAQELEEEEDKELEDLLLC